MHNLTERLLAEIPTGSKVLDVGCGMSGYLTEMQSIADLHLLDAHLPYLQRAPLLRPAPMFVGTAQTILPLFGDKVFDVATAFDMPEHLSPYDAVNTINEMRRIAKKVVLFIPEGNHPQTEDYFKVGGDFWQTHRSTWNLRDYGLEVSAVDGQSPTQVIYGTGWKIERWEGFHSVEGKDPNALFIVSQ